MTTNYHTPIDSTKCYNKASDIELPFSELDAQVTANVSDIATNTANITTNTNNIATNTSDIATNTAAITALQTQPYDIPIMWHGLLTDSLVLIRIPMVRTVIYPAGLTVSTLKAMTAATAETIISLKKNGTEFGTMTFAIAGDTATMAAASETTVAAGDILTLVAPATADDSLADLYGMLVGSR